MIQIKRRTALKGCAGCLGREYSPFWRNPGSVACITRNELPRRAHMAGDLRLCSMSLGGALFFFVIDMEANKR
jgi:hypothetical protein